MPFQPINFANISPIGKPWARNFAENLRQGMEMGNLPQKLMGEKEQMALANALNREKVQQEQAVTPYAPQNAMNNASILQNTADYAPDMSKSTIEHLQGQTARDKAMAAIGGMQFTGGAGLVQGVEAMKRLYGADSPQAKEAQYLNDLLGNQRQSSVGRLHSEIERLNGQLSDPGLSNEERSNIQKKRNQLENKAFNEQSDLDVRTKGLGAIQLEQTWDSFEDGEGIEALKKYTGPKGTFNYYNDLRKYLTTNESNPDFDKLLVAKSQLHTFADQYMKAFPGSHSYERMKNIYENTNPQGFLMPPGGLEAQIRGMWSTIKPELGTLKKVLTGENPLRVENKTKEQNVNTVQKEADAYRAKNPKPEQKPQEKPKDLYWNGSDFVERGFK